MMVGFWRGLIKNNYLVISGERMMIQFFPGGVLIPVSTESLGPCFRRSQTLDVVLGFSCPKCVTLNYGGWHKIPTSFPTLPIPPRKDLNPQSLKDIETGRLPQCKLKPGSRSMGEWNLLMYVFPTTSPLSIAIKTYHLLLHVQIEVKTSASNIVYNNNSTSVRHTYRGKLQDVEDCGTPSSI